VQMNGNVRAVDKLAYQLDSMCSRKYTQCEVAMQAYLDNFRYLLSKTCIDYPSIYRQILKIGKQIRLLLEGSSEWRKLLVLLIESHPPVVVLAEIATQRLANNDVLDFATRKQRKIIEHFARKTYTGHVSNCISLIFNNRACKFCIKCGQYSLCINCDICKKCDVIEFRKQDAIQVERRTNEVFFRRAAQMLADKLGQAPLQDVFEKLLVE